MSSEASDSESWFCLTYGNVERREKRREVVSGQKNKREYQVYAQAMPPHLREPEDPGTPDSERPMSKREWEKLMFEWRCHLRKAMEQLEAKVDVTDRSHG
jgi:hypothetical protein